MRNICIFALLFSLLFLVPPVFSAEKEWTYLVFMNADNNLDPYADEDFSEMMKVGSSQFLNIVTLTDREKGPAALHYVEKGNVVTVKPMGELDMGDYRVMVDFVRWAAENYPAKHYVLSIWNHGSGWKNKNGAPSKGISYDDSTGNYITTPQLGTAHREIKKILGKNLDILSMDACLMQMMEVAYEIHDTCDFIVASEELEPGHGYPYDSLLSGLKPGTSAEAFCRHWVPDFMAAYSGGVYGNEDCTLSAINCAKLPGLKDAIDGFAKTSMAGSFAPQFTQALNKVQKFDYRTNIDFWHLVKLLRPAINNPEMQNALKKLDTALAQTVIANGNTGGSLGNSLGLAIYFPQSATQFSSEYSTLRFSQNSLHDEMVKDYYKKATVQGLISDVKNRDLSSLREFVGNRNPDDTSLNKYVISRINFLIYSEGNYSQSLREEISGLLRLLRE